MRPAQNHLESHHALEPDLPCLVHDPHAAVAQYVLNLVAVHGGPSWIDRDAARLRNGLILPSLQCVIDLGSRFDTWFTASRTMNTAAIRIAGIGRRPFPRMSIATRQLWRHQTPPRSGCKT